MLMDTLDKRIGKTGRIMGGAAAGTVFLVNDTGELHVGISRILGAAGYEVRTFDTAERFLEEQDCDVPGCLLLDIRLPGMSGLDMQRSLAGSARAHPTVILTVQGDIY